MKRILIIVMMVLMLTSIQMAAGLTSEEGRGVEAECSQYTDCGDCGAIKLEGWEDEVDDSGTWDGITIDDAPSNSKFNFTWNSNGQTICEIVVKAGNDGYYVYEVNGATSGTIDINTMPDKEGKVEVQRGISHVTFCYSCGGGNEQEIPEFPTIALPVAAILGLAFFFQRRKE